MLYCHAAAAFHVPQPHLEPSHYFAVRMMSAQLVTMVKEQYNKVTTARAAGDSSELHQAKFVFLGTVTTHAAGSSPPTVVSAGLFYPRWCSKDGAEMPHMYVELLCCNSPGRGYGSVLLSHIEQFTAAGADYLSEAFAGCTAAVISPVQTGSTIGALGTELTAAAAAAAASSAGLTTAVSMPIVLPLLAEGLAVPADPLSGCCTACGAAADGSSSSMSNDSLAVVVGAELSCATSAVTAAAGAPACMHQYPACQVQPQAVPAVLRDSATPAPAVGTDMVSASAQVAIISTAAAPVAAAAAEIVLPAAKRIRGVKLLSVASARSFYERHGYGQPDMCREMFKPLLLLPARGAAGSTSTSSICSMMSVSSSSSNAVC
jgi:hypothetical protein